MYASLDTVGAQQTSVHGNPQGVLSSEFQAYDTGSSQFSKYLPRLPRLLLRACCPPHLHCNREGGKRAQMPGSTGRVAASAKSPLLAHGTWTGFCVAAHFLPRFTQGHAISSSSPPPFLSEATPSPNRFWMTLRWFLIRFLLTNPETASRTLALPTRESR